MKIPDIGVINAFDIVAQYYYIQPGNFSYYQYQHKLESGHDYLVEIQDKHKFNDKLQTTLSNLINYSNSILYGDLSPKYTVNIYNCIKFYIIPKLRDKSDICFIGSVSENIVNDKHS